jgi:mono/diheme cytochrome c family protein
MSRAGLLAACAAVCAAIVSIIGWQTETTTSGTTAAAETLPLDGASLFQSKGCAACHTGPDSASPMGFLSLVGAADWAADRRPGLGAQQYLAESMRTPSAFISPGFVGPIGGTDAMPDLDLSEAEIDALVSYLMQG